MGKANTHKNMLLQYAQGNAATKNCNRLYLHTTQKKVS